MVADTTDGFGSAIPKGRQSSPNPNPNPNRSMTVLVGFMGPQLRPIKLFD